jgi:DNA helicase II / ATP-dependent DNA helicase PcrA
MGVPSAPAGRRADSLSGVNLPVDGRFLIIAGPGAGKTSLIVSRVKQLLESEKPRGGLLALTFTNKAAMEVAGRLDAGEDGDADTIFVGTFHAFGSKVLHAHGDVIDLPTNFVLYTPEDQAALVTELQLTGDLPETLSVSTVCRVIAHEKELASERLASGESLESILEGQPGFLRIYQTALRNVRGLDFSDLIFETNRLFARAPHVLHLYRTIYSHVLVDEFQDTTPGQYALLRQLVDPAAGNLFAVADEDQLIFEWNEARLDTLNRFCDNFGPSVVYSTLCHRCPREVVIAANAVIRKNRFRFPDKPDISTTRAAAVGNPIRLMYADSEDHEAELVAEDIRKLVQGGTNPSTIAIIARAGWLLERFETALSTRGIPSARPSPGGLGETEEADVVVRLLRWIQNEWDVPSVRLVLGFFFPELASKVDQTVIVARGKGVSLEAALLTNGISTENSALELINEVVRLRLLTGNAARMLDELVDRLLPMLIRLASDTTTGAEIRRVVLNLQELVRRLYPRHEVAVFEFLASIPSMVLPRDRPDSGDTEQTVSLLTCHQAKGTEFPHVYAASLEEGILPDYRQARATEGTEAERRLFYVTLTRTITQITLSFSKSRANLQGERRDRKPSRFLSEIPTELVHVYTP